MPSSTSEHIGQLDGLRGVFCLMVLVSHSSVLPAVFGTPLLDLGVNGVRGFMVLSGFLITRILIRAKESGTNRAFRDFYIRRAARIFPIYYACLGVTWMVWRIRPHLASLLYLTNYLPATKGMAHSWSLSVEEQFYVFWPVLIYLLPRRRAGYLGTLTVIGVSILLAVGLSLTGSTQLQLELYSHTQYCALLFGLGALMAYLERTVRTTPRLFEVLLACALALIAARLACWLYVRPETHPEGVTGAGILVLIDHLFGASLAASVVAGALYGSDKRVLKILGTGPLAFFGAISYGLYLYHFPIFLYFGDVAHKWTSWGTTLEAWAITMAVTVVSYYWFEQPIRERARRLTARREAAAAPIPA